MIDEEGYRLNVGIILCNQDNELLWARRIGQDAWQFPQGGIQQRESPYNALLRELHEEIGLKPEDVSVIGSTNDWLKYDLPPHLIRHGSKPLCIGQKQIWYLLRLTGDENNIVLNQSDRPEFDEWRWVKYWFPLEEVVAFKREVYSTALNELECFLPMK